MQKEITITVEAKNEKNEGFHKNLIIKELKKENLPVQDLTFVFIKKSIDARHGQVKLHLRYKVYIGEKPQINENALPEWKKVAGNHKVIIVGSGPAGLFGALKLLEKGIQPIIIERGAETSQRKIDIAKISTKDYVNENSNYCFGEGGAGTFSDGKLYTRSNKRGDIGSILRIFNYFGANEKILTDAHPHIGTNRLPQVVNAMCNKIRECGGTIYFNTLVTDLIVENEDVKGVKIKNTLTSQEDSLFADAVLLATGHSACDVYKMIAKHCPKALEAKTFAAGVRVEHPRTLIDSIQYHGKAGNALGAAEYRLTTQVEERGVYSFCMCPGGFVVPSSSGPEEIVVNGMSAAERNSKWSNSAIVVEIRPEDIPQKYQKQAQEMGCNSLAGLLFRTELEKNAKEHGEGQKAPAQRLSDFLKNQKSDNLPESSYIPGLVSSNLNQWLPQHICKRLKQGFYNFDKNMKGFITQDALLIAIETRTSTPVRILRDKESLECVGLNNLYPTGEGSGYSGGIVSSAMDGQNSCEKIIAKLSPSPNQH